jgi:hypothetical protein
LFSGAALLRGVSLGTGNLGLGGLCLGSFGQSRVFSGFSGSLLRVCLSTGAGLRLQAGGFGVTGGLVFCRASLRLLRSVALRFGGKTGGLGQALGLGSGPRGVLIGKALQLGGSARSLLLCLLLCLGGISGLAFKRKLSRVQLFLDAAISDNRVKAFVQLGRGFEELAFQLFEEGHATPEILARLRGNTSRSH